MQPSMPMCPCRILQIPHVDPLIFAACTTQPHISSQTNGSCGVSCDGPCGFHVALGFRDFSHPHTDPATPAMQLLTIFTQAPSISLLNTLEVLSCNALAFPGRVGGG